MVYRAEMWAQFGFHNKEGMKESDKGHAVGKMCHAKVRQADTPRYNTVRLHFFVIYLICLANKTGKDFYLIVIFPNLGKG